MNRRNKITPPSEIYITPNSPVEINPSKSYIYKQTRKGGICCYLQKGGDFLWEDEGAQRAHHPITSRVTQITPSHKGPARDLGESLKVYVLPGPDFPSARKLTFVNVIARTTAHTT